MLGFDFQYLLIFLYLTLDYIFLFLCMSSYFYYILDIVNDIVDFRFFYLALKFVHLCPIKHFNYGTSPLDCVALILLLDGSVESQRHFLQLPLYCRLHLQTLSSKDLVRASFSLG